MDRTGFGLYIYIYKGECDFTHENRMLLHIRFLSLLRTSAEERTQKVYVILFYYCTSSTDSSIFYICVLKL